MRYTQKILLIFLSACLLATQAQAGLKIKRPGRKAVPVVTASAPKRTVATPGRRTVLPKRTALSAKRRKQILETRVERTFQQAMEAYARATNNNVLWEAIPPQSNRLVKLFPLKPAHVYPDKPFLLHPVRGPQLAEAYLLAKNNRLFLQHLRRMETFWPRFDEAIPRFYEEARSFVQPENPLQYAADHIPAEAKNIFLGEIHGYPELSEFVSQFLPLLRKHYPQKPIFLFTEFLPDPASQGGHALTKVMHSDPFKYYQRVWETADKQGIRVIGLEPKFADANHFIKTPHFNKEESISIWSTLEGMRIRNEHWWNILQQYRAQNPEAIFVVYTGSAHSLYTYEFSLAARAPKGTAFMLELVPSKPLRPQERVFNTDYADNLERTDPLLSFPQRVLHWQSGDLAPLSGFDMRIKVPVNLEYKKMEIEQQILMQNQIEKMNKLFF